MSGIISKIPLGNIGGGGGGSSGKTSWLSETVENAAIMSIDSIPEFEEIEIFWTLQDKASGNSRPSIVINDDTTAANYKMNQVFDRLANTLANSAFNGSEAFFRMIRQQFGAGEEYFGVVKILNDTLPSYDNGITGKYETYNDATYYSNGRIVYGGSGPITKISIKNTNVLDAIFDGEMYIKVVAP